MEYLAEKDVIVVFDKRYKLETLSKKLSDLSAEQIKEFFINRDIKIPKKLNMMALYFVLNERIKTLDSTSLNKEGFTKLLYYSDFCEYQLTSLFEKIGTEEDFSEYRKELWLLILKNAPALNLMDGELQHLINVKKIEIEAYAEYIKKLTDVTIDFTRDFDGITNVKLENTLRNTFSQDEIRGIASKYGITIPNRLKKDELLSYVKEILKSKKKLTKALEDEVTKMTVVQLNSFCELHKIEISANLKKNELVYLFLFLKKQIERETIETIKLNKPTNCKALKFTIDLDEVSFFGKGKPKKVIHYEGEPEEKEEKVLIPITINGKKVLYDPEHSDIIFADSPLAKKKNSKPVNSLKPAEEPVVEEAAEEPVVEEVAEESVVEEVTEEPVVEEAAEEPVVEEVAEEPAVEEVAEEPAVEEVAEELAVEEVAEEPAVEEVAEEPAVEEAIEEPTDDELEEDFDEEFDDDFEEPTEDEELDEDFEEPVADEEVIENHEESNVILEDDVNSDEVPNESNNQEEVEQNPEENSKEDISEDFMEEISEKYKDVDNISEFIDQLSPEDYDFDDDDGELDYLMDSTTEVENDSTEDVISDQNNEKQNDVEEINEESNNQSLEEQNDTETAEKADENHEETDVVLNNESYDEEFAKQENNIIEKQDVSCIPIENMYFRNKKLMSKKKAIIVPVVSTMLVISAVVAIFFVLKMFM